MKLIRVLMQDELLSGVGKESAWVVHHDKLRLILEKCTENSTIIERFGPWKP